MPRQLIGAHRVEPRVILVDSQAVVEVGAELLQRPPHALDDVFGLAPQPRRAERREARGSLDLGGEAVLEIERLVAGRAGTLPRLAGGRGGGPGSPQAP